MTTTLFRLPTPKRIAVTIARLRAMDRIELASLDGRPLPKTVIPQVLRRLIKDELVTVKLGSPAVYRLTPLGRMVRSRPVKPRR